MKAIKRMHTLVESDDLERVRASQENISALLKHRELNYEPFQVGEIPSEWVSVKRSHMRKFVIFYVMAAVTIQAVFIMPEALPTNCRVPLPWMCWALTIGWRRNILIPQPRRMPWQCGIDLMHLGYGARDVIVAGDSAGGNLALSLVLKLQRAETNFAEKGLIRFFHRGQTWQAAASLMRQRWTWTRSWTGNIWTMPFAAYASGQDLKNPLIYPAFRQISQGFSANLYPGGQQRTAFCQIHYCSKKNLGKIPCPSTSWRVQGNVACFPDVTVFKTAYDAMDQVAGNLSSISVVSTIGQELSPVRYRRFGEKCMRKQILRLIFDSVSVV